MVDLLASNSDNANKKWNIICMQVIAHFHLIMFYHFWLWLYILNIVIFISACILRFSTFGLLQNDKKVKALDKKKQEKLILNNVCAVDKHFLISHFLWFPFYILKFGSFFFHFSIVTPTKWDVWKMWTCEILLFIYLDLFISFRYRDRKYTSENNIVIIIIIEIDFLVINFVYFLSFYLIQ